MVTIKVNVKYKMKICLKSLIEFISIFAVADCTDGAYYYIILIYSYDNEAAVVTVICLVLKTKTLRKLHLFIIKKIKPDLFLSVFLYFSVTLLKKLMRLTSFLIF